jgi:hypothetical protein
MAQTGQHVSSIQKREGSIERIVQLLVKLVTLGITDERLGI